MGMFDEITFEPISNHQQLKCAAGHELDIVFQTKSLYSCMEHYIVFEKNLYKVATKVEKFFKKQGDVLWRGQQQELEPVRTTTTLRIYGDCKKCRPVFSSDASGLTVNGQKLISSDRPWCEFDAEFFRGTLTSITPKELETREDVIKKLSESREILSEDDPRVKNRLDLWHELYSMEEDK